MGNGSIPDTLGEPSRRLERKTSLRRYRVAASCYEPDTGQAIECRLEGLGTHLTALLEQQKPDLVVIPEMALVPDMDKQPNCEAEPIDGPTISLGTELAARHHANLVLPIIEDDGGRKYNTAVLIDRSGRVAGKYRKMTPTVGEMDLGVLPGPQSPDPVVLDGLRIGTAICYDENYPDLLWNYLRKQIDLLVFPSYTFGGRLMAAWALYCGVPLVCAFPWEAVIYDRDGSILVEAGTWTSTVRLGNHAAWIACDLDMQCRVYHLDDNQNKIAEMGRRYGGKVDIRLAVREARMQVTVRSDDLDIDHIQQEMGLVPLNVYIAETRARADRLREAGGKP